MVPHVASPRWGLQSDGAFAVTIGRDGFDPEIHKGPGWENIHSDDFWSPPSCQADVTTQGAGEGDPGYLVPDGLITAADINAFVNFWVAGCP